MKKIPNDRLFLYFNLAVLFSFTFWRTILGLTYYLAIPIYIFLAAGMICAPFWALIYGFRSFSLSGWKAFQSFALCLITILTLYFVPLSRADIFLDFWVLLIPREAIVHQVKTGLLKPDGCCDISLPWWGFLLSRPGGDLRIMQFHELNVMFYDYKGLLSNAGGFVYSADNHPEEALGHPVKKFKDHWYYVVESD